eukprot:CAMPEP_0181324090 /NCGR_PEP_ID=MMETSP1101-20121128/20158_1 /TAXON_ID=46948 /ORGANISM="Rhodomonas abbreviata, Strain Caron Lab Isolate" /LENGTH=84 /DNA_ID=CAMNT_0023432211 /DNA_START=71 /DNA_END=323 /DNA_ORIENTATION=-
MAATSQEATTLDESGADTSSKVVGGDGLGSRRVRDNLDVGCVNAGGASAHVLRPRILSGEDRVGRLRDGFEHGIEQSGQHCVNA